MAAGSFPGFPGLAAIPGGIQGLVVQTAENREAAASQAGPEAGLSDDMYREPRSKVWQEAWKVNEALLLQMRDEVAARGAKFYVVVLTIGAQVLPDPANRVAFAKDLGVPDLLYADHRLEKFCRQEGIPILLLTPTFQDYATAHHVYLLRLQGTLRCGHWDQQGHRLAGDTIARCCAINSLDFSQQFFLRCFLVSANTFAC